MTSKGSRGGRPRLMVKTHFRSAVGNYEKFSAIWTGDFDNRPSGSLILGVLPVPKPRMTQRDKWKKRPCVVRYRDFCDEIRDAWGGEKLPDAFDVAFFLPMPASWSRARKERHAGGYHQQKPDRDNLLKALQDALEGRDERIADGRVAKFWSYEPAIWISW